MLHPNRADNNFFKASSCPTWQEKKILLEQMTSGVVTAHPTSPTEIQSPAAERWDGPKTEHKCHICINIQI